MRKTIFIMLASLMLASCAAFEEAYYVDREFGNNSNAVFNHQIAEVDKDTVAGPPEELMGIDAERLMTTHNATFGKPSTETNVFNISLTN